MARLPVRWAVGGIGLTAVVLALTAGTACGQQYVPGTASGDATTKAIEDADYTTVILNTFGTFTIALGAFLALSLLGSILMHFYFRVTTPTDPAQLALTDPWIRAQLARRDGGAPEVGTAPEP